MISSIFDTLLSPSWIPFWTIVEGLSIVAIGIGCAGEWRIARFKRSVRPEEDPLVVYHFKEKWDSFFSGMVAVGIGVELIAFLFSYRASSLEIEGLQKENSQLQSQLQPRIINVTKIQNFIFLTKFLPKFPIRVIVRDSRLEPYSFAYQIRDMLNRSDYKTPISDASFQYGIDIDPALTIVNTNTVLLNLSDQLSTNTFSDVVFITEDTNKCKVFSYSGIEKTNGLTRVSVPAGDMADTYGALINAFNQIGVAATFQSGPAWAGTNRCAIVIVERPR